MERNEHAATVERLRRLNRNGYAVRAEFACQAKNDILLVIITGNMHINNIDVD